METVSATGCIQIVNGVVSAFMQEVVMNNRNDRLNRLNNLERVYSEAENKIRTKQGELKSLASAWSDEFGPTHAAVSLLKEAIEDKVQLLALRKQNDQQRTALRMPGGITFDLGALAVRRQVLANQEKILQEQVDKLATETRQLVESRSTWN